MTKHSHRFRNRKGERYGRLIVLYEHATNKGVVQWMCQCDCGGIHIVTSQNLTSGRTKSCGCLRKDKARQTIKSIVPNRTGDGAYKKVYWTYHSNAKKRGHEFDLTFESFKALILQNCSYCGVEPSQVKKTYYNDESCLYTGIDRIDSQQGYTSDNCVPCCRDCNLAKHKMTRQQFLEWVSRVYNHLKNEIEQ